jgi:hypothetical protein
MKMEQVAAEWEISIDVCRRHLLEKPIQAVQVSQERA